MGTVRRGNLHGEHEREDQSGETLRAAPRCSGVDDGRGDGGVVGAGVGAQAPATCLTPHKVDAHWVCSNAVVVEHRSSGSHA